jgi:hypothetical protein
MLEKKYLFGIAILLALTAAIYGNKMNEKYVKK